MLLLLLMLHFLEGLSSLGAIISLKLDNEQEMDSEIRRIAMQRISTLFLLARETLPKDPALAQRYIKIARRIAMAARLRLPKQLRLNICRHCKSYILPGVNCRVRTRRQREPHIVITCLNCGEQTRIRLRHKGEKQHS